MSVVAESPEFPASLKPRPFWVSFSDSFGVLVAEESPAFAKKHGFDSVKVMAETENLAIQQVAAHIGLLEADND